MMDMCVRHRGKCYDVGKLKYLVNCLCTKSELVRKLCAQIISADEQNNQLTQISGIQRLL